MKDATLTILHYTIVIIAALFVGVLTIALMFGSPVTATVMAQDEGYPITTQPPAWTPTCDPDEFTLLWNPDSDGYCDVCECEVDQPAPPVPPAPPVMPPSKVDIPLPAQAQPEPLVLPEAPFQIR